MNFKSIASGSVTLLPALGSFKAYEKAIKTAGANLAAKGKGEGTNAQLYAEFLTVTAGFRTTPESFQKYLKVIIG